MEFTRAGVDCILETVPTSFIMPSLNEPLVMVSERQRVGTSELIDCLAYGGRWATLNSNLQLDPPNAKAMYLRNANLGFAFNQGGLLSGTCVPELIANMTQLLSYLISPKLISNGIDGSAPMITSPLLAQMAPPTSPSLQRNSLAVPGKPPTLILPPPIIFSIDKVAESHHTVWNTRFGNLPHHGRVLIEFVSNSSSV